MTLAQTDAGVLGRLINLEPVPQSVEFEIVEISENDSQLFAVLSYDESTYSSVADRLAQESGDFAGEEFLLQAPEWFDPARLPEFSQSGDKVSVPARSLMSAASYARSPWLGGAAIALADGTGILVVLYTQ